MIYPDLPGLAISVRQPWAWAIVYAGKDIENRDWRSTNPGLSFRGPVCIHASGGLTRDEYEVTAEWFDDIGVECPPAHKLQRGGIVGTAVITDIVTASPSRWFFGSKGLVLTEQRPIEFIPCGGALGFFNWRQGVHSQGPIPPALWMLPEDERPVRPAKSKAAPKAPEPGTLL